MKTNTKIVFFVEGGAEEEKEEVGEGEAGLMSAAAPANGADAAAAPATGGIG
jgi:hypothetical protein